jgi:hypothetical protein
MSTKKSPLYFPWLLIICVSDDIVVTSQSINKKIWAPTPLLLCSQTRKCPTLLKQLWGQHAFHSSN